MPPVADTYNALAVALDDLERAGADAVRHYSGEGDERVARALGAHAMRLAEELRHQFHAVATSTFSPSRFGEEKEFVL